MSGAARAAAVALLLLAGAWWGWQRWSGATAPELRRPERSRANEVVAAATAPEAVDAGTDATSAAPAISAIRGETRRAAALVDLAAPPGPRKPLVLRVVDATTQLDLRGVTVRYRPVTLTPEMPARFDPHFVELAQGASPLTLAPPAGEVRVDEIEVACTGHQSRRMSVEWTSGGERRVELLAAGSLRLSVRDAPYSAQLEAHLFDGDVSPPIGMGDALAARIASAEGAAFAPIELLAAGRWRVELFDRGVQGDPQVGGGEVVVVAGVEAKLELDYVARPLQALVAIGGRVVIDRAWFEDASMQPAPPTRLSFWQEGRPSIRRSPSLWDVELEPPSDPAVIPFDGGVAWPGLLLVVVDDWEWSALVEVPAEGSRDLEIVVPPPADVIVTVRDAATGKPVEGVHLNASGNSVMSWQSRLVVSPVAWARGLGSSDADGRLGFRMTAGNVNLNDLTDRPRNWPFRFVPGSNEVELTVGALAKLSLLLRDGDAIVPWGDDANVIVEAGGRRCYTCEDRGRAGEPAGCVMVDADGPVLVSVDGVAGYETSERFDVSLIRGESVAVEIPLRRRN